MKICNTYDTPSFFDKFIYKPMFCSGDKLPYCPICEMSPYDVDYDDYHTDVQSSIKLESE